MSLIESSGLDFQEFPLLPDAAPSLDRHPASKGYADTLTAAVDVRNLTLEPTGFDRPDLVVVSYDAAERKITLSGAGWKAYYRGVQVTALVNGWVSDAHSADDGSYFLYYNGSAFVWGTVAWDFSDLLIAMVFRDTANFCLRECHGFEPHQSHKEFHERFGTYLTSGGDLDDFTLASTTATNRRPTINQTTIWDEDLVTVLPALATNAYTWLQLDGADADTVLTVDQTEIVNLNGNIPYWNQFTGGAWQESAFTNNQYGKVFVMAIPVTADAPCQKNRYVFVQPQTVSTTLATIQGVTPASINLGHIGSALAEYVFIGEIIIQYVGPATNNWVLTAVNKLTGSRALQIGSPAGNYLSAVTTDATLSGSGTAADPIGLAADCDHTGTIRSLLKIVNKTANASLTAAECRGAVVTNAGAAGTLEFTLPAAVVGASVTIYAKEAEIIEAIPAGGERFSSAAADEQLDSEGDLGNSLTLVCMETGVWEVVSSSGTWEVPVA
jgi:archaellin